MILEFFTMGGYGFYIWLSYAFAALSLVFLYYRSVKKLNSIKELNIFTNPKKLKAFLFQRRRTDFSLISSLVSISSYCILKARYDFKQIHQN